MSIRNYKTKCYVPPIGEDLQHDFCDNGVSIHSDVTLLSRLSDMRLSQSLMDGILSRFSQVKDDLPQELKDKFSALDDFKKMEFTDSRYLQSLSDKKSALSSFIDDYDKKVSEMKDSEEKTKLATARKNLDNYILSMFSGSETEDKE
ncbi:hypothetical protein E2488_15580 [Gramella jeungdoensis]|jgi:hypothetical protein|uniref:Uncharacterized protein n=1 Tax=Gramella jeungdoensis TaxID=708091 RepID=A0A4Y8AMT8_9FLAO|nr:hypothetical protein [Gramella jeungdoensis]TEW71536.1 hypothetical protein E2488_15580 [Gramella jeungdoensis]